ncbi:hypothetical protein [Thermostaphylospora chromogena]|uniref:Sigma E regulatory protein, MucB/RseB n=1 Tax=Thermostaphylospora chromogena TaxID=35622 RepID=A0A1H1EAR6_9ACTN|nr:hypothetical protein [Thermostaphylospora chromogena]SDQ85724.1 hypothetical protein SAMN04489764_2389 [Thermostaphylospora chromogena]
MRRMIAVLAAALVAPALATASPASAQVAPIDPAAAMKGQLKPKHGVQFSETAKLTYDGRSFMSQTTKGAYEFNKSGVAASDTKFQIKISKDLRELLKGEEGETLSAFAEQTRLISVKGKNYLNGGAFSEGLPEGKSWVRVTGKDVIPPKGMTSQPIDVTEPKTYGRLLADATTTVPGGKVGGARTTRYKGTITVGELYKLSPSFRKTQGERPTGSAAKTKLTWSIWVDTRGLPRRVFTYSEEELGKGLGALRDSVDTYYTAWGSRVTVQEPPAGKVVDIKDLDEDVPDITRLPTDINGTLSLVRE